MATSAVMSTDNFETPSEDYHSCTAAISINRGCNSMAIAWRGKIPIAWHFQSTVYTSTRIRRLRQSFVSLSSTEALRKQADNALLYVLYQDTNIVELQLYDDHFLQHPHLKAREFTISSDNNLMLTSDHTGKISIWVFLRLSLIYQLGSINYSVRGVVSSPDGQRLYDIRDSACNISQPEVLARPDDQDLEDRSTVDELSLVSREPTIAYIDTLSSTITAIAKSG
ncbi:nacht and wd domain-containing protein [Stemphylium lycopersici]|nr:nacht and wd domain-containing protein [Stemphylium lycopersici]